MNAKVLIRFFVIIILILIPIFLFIGTGCKSSKKEEQVARDKEALRNPDNLVKINKRLVNNDAERIKAYVKRRKWDMQVTQTGLWYMIYEKGVGEKAEIDKYATLKYTVDLLNGKHCYSSDSLGLKHFQIGKGGVESGLEQAILMLREGDKARFIMPPHLAHGLIGDQDRIPARAILVYDVELIKISDE